jgi:hypothetical protein
MVTRVSGWRWWCWHQKVNNLECWRQQCPTTWASDVTSQTSYAKCILVQRYSLERNLGYQVVPFQGTWFLMEYALSQGDFASLFSMKIDTDRSSLVTTNLGHFTTFATQWLALHNSQVSYWRKCSCSPLKIGSSPWQPWPNGMSFACTLQLEVIDWHWSIQWPM